MAIRKMSDGISSWNSKMPFPKDAYILKCVEESFAPSKSSGNPMLTRTWEIISPEIIVIGDKQVNIGGVKLTQYRPVKCKNSKEEAEATGKEWNEEKSDKAFGSLRDELIAMGFDPNGEIDDENPPRWAENKTVLALCYGKKDVARKPPTREQLSKGIKQGDEIKDAYGKPIETYTPVIETVLSLADDKTNSAW